MEVDDYSETELSSLTITVILRPTLTIANLAKVALNEIEKRMDSRES
jgi:hypothetical protein